MAKYLTRKVAAELLLKIRAELKRAFPLGCRVRASRLAISKNVISPQYRKRQGTIVGYSHGVSPKVLWDGRKTPKGYHNTFISRVRKPATPGAPRT